jgi:hypothetical protein
VEERRLGSWALIAGAVMVHLVFWLSLVYGFLDPLFNDATHRLPRGLDFYAVYQKSHEFAEGKSLYTRIDPDELVVPHSAPYFRYLPSWAWFMANTFCRLSPATAYWLWVACCEAMLLACLAMFLARAPSLRQRAWMVVFWMCFTPYYLELFMGQFTFMTAGLLALCWFALDRRREWSAGLWLTVSVCLKHVGLVLLPPLLALRRFRAVALAVAVPSLFSALYFGTHPEELRLFLDVFAYGTPNRLHAGNLGLTALVGTLLRLAGLEATGPVAGWALNAIVLAWLVRVTWRQRRTQNPILLLAFWLTSYFLVGPDVYEHHFVLLLPVLAWAWQTRPSKILIVLYLWLALPTVFVLVDLPELPRQRFLEVENLWWRDGYHARILVYHLWKITPAIGLFAWLPRLFDASSRPD